MRGARIKEKLSDLADIANWWCYEKNGDIPVMGSSSKKKFWFKCPNNHEFELACGQFKHGDRCRTCAFDRQRERNANLTFDKVKDVDEWWDKEKNIIDIKTLRQRSETLVWFKCPIGHSYQASCKSFYRGFRCAECGKKKFKNKPKTTMDKVKDALEWYDQEKNELPITKAPSSGPKKFWFKCPKGHSFEMSAGHFKDGNRCGYCSGHKPLAGFNTFELNQDAIEWWDYEKNTILIDNITKRSLTKVWMRCPDKGHSFEVSCDAFAAGSRCRECAIQKQKETFMSLDKVKDALEWWDYEKNTDDITKVAKSSDTKVWFKCSKGHSYQTKCRNFARGNRCRICPRILTGYMNVKHILKGKDTIDTFDKVKDALEWWDYEKNTDDITKIASSNKKKIWIKCSLGHSSQISTSHFKRGQRCGYCSGTKPLAGFNTFELNQDAIEWWDYEKNTIPINSITRRSLTKVWMKCPLKGHSYQVSCDGFASGNRCPDCNNKGYSKECIEWLSCIEKKYGIQIRHAEKPEREFPIPETRYKADGYVQIGDRQIIFEYHGLWCHGLKGLEKQDELAPFKDKTNAQAYADTLIKENKIRELGYELVVIWSDDYLVKRQDYLEGNFEIEGM